MRALVVTSMYPTPRSPGLGGFVRDQVEALREIDGLEVELFAFEPGAARRYAGAARDLRRAHGHQRFGDIVDELAGQLTAHLTHEESDGLALIDASLTPAEWQHFAQVHTERIRGDASTYMPWLLNGASPQMLDTILGKFPPPLLAAFREEWGPRYAGLDVWNAALPGRA